jgi:F-type H+-transporting ATPase subunit a
MGDHDTWYTVLMPEFWARLEGHAGAQSLGVKETLTREWQFAVFGATHFSLIHVGSALIAFFFILFATWTYRRSITDPTEGVVPSRNYGLASMTNGFVGVVFKMTADVMGTKHARAYLPLIGTLALFIFCCNIQALVPGFLPATDTLKTNAALAIMVFVVYNFVGLKHNGIHHILHLAGPSFPIAGIKFPWLFPLMFPIEVVSHIVRPISLSLRLMGNMVADHKAVGVVLVLAPLLVPVPFLLLGVVVCIVQTLVFSLLTVIYIGMAIEQAEEH